MIWLYDIFFDKCEAIVAATVLSTLAHAPESSSDWSWEHYCQEQETKKLQKYVKIVGVAWLFKDCLRWLLPDIYADLG